MRLRRIELVVIGVTLAFAMFMGGFFTGRNWSEVNIVSVSAQDGESGDAGVSIQTHERSVSNTPESTESTDSSDAVEAREDRAEMPTDIVEQRPEADDSTQSEVVGTPNRGDGKININIASQSELTDLPGIGNVLASRIVDYRRQHGDFLRIEDLRNVSGIGEKRYEAIQDKITVG